MKRLIFVVPFVLLVCGTGAGFLMADLQAQSYPSRSIQLIIPGAAGSILDVVGRLTGDEIGKIIGAHLIPVDKPGLHSLLAQISWSRARKMAIRFAYTNSSAIIYARVLNPETVPYDPDKDLDPLGFHLYVRMPLPF